MKFQDPHMRTGCQDSRTMTLIFTPKRQEDNIMEGQGVTWTHLDIDALHPAERNNVQNFSAAPHRRRTSLGVEVLRGKTPRPRKHLHSRISGDWIFQTRGGSRYHPRLNREDTRSVALQVFITGLHCISRYVVKETTELVSGEEDMFPRHITLATVTAVPRCICPDRSSPGNNLVGSDEVR